MWCDGDGLTRCTECYTIYHNLFFIKASRPDIYIQEMVTPTSSIPADSPLRNRALRLLWDGTGNPFGDFRDGQWEAIDELVNGRGRLLLVQRAGWGKSAVYFIAAKLLRELGLGPTLLVSPLLALMRNQVESASKMGVRTSIIDSTNGPDWNTVLEDVKSDSVDVLLVSPERFENPWFRDKMGPVLFNRIGMLVIDEAHCISDWGHDFRPQYRRLQNVLPQLPPNLRVLATTATANGRVMQDISEVLGADTQIRRGDLALPNISFQTIRLNHQAERMAWLAENVPKIDGSGIIYALTIRDVDRVAGFLQSRGIDAHAYHSDIPNEIRPELEQMLIDNEVKALVATTALGMGFDKPDLKFVIHFQSPSSPIAYYQQIGRAGRALNGAQAVLLGGTEEDGINDYFINSAFPREEEVRNVLSTLEDSDGALSVQDFERLVDMKRGRVEKTLQLLSFESPSPVEGESGMWSRTSENLSEAFWDRVKRVTELRRDEQLAMNRYSTLDSGHMTFLLAQLGSADERPVRPKSANFTSAVSEHNVSTACLFLKRQFVPIQARKRMPSGLIVPGIRNEFSGENVNQEGRALSIFGDSGWGATVKSNKQVQRNFNDDLVQACVSMISEWLPHPYPTWVTSVPSRNGSSLVMAFATRLARSLGLPYVHVLDATGATEPQKDMQNSFHQARNAFASMKTAKESASEDPLFLVDDIVDSGWTLTVAGHLLRNLGSGPVFPLALAQA